MHKSIVGLQKGFQRVLEDSYRDSKTSGRGFYEGLGLREYEGCIWFRLAWVSARLCRCQL